MLALCVVVAVSGCGAGVEDEVGVQRSAVASCGCSYDENGELLYNEPTHHHDVVTSTQGGDSKTGACSCTYDEQTHLLEVDARCPVHGSP